MKPQTLFNFALMLLLMGCAIRVVNGQMIYTPPAAAQATVAAGSNVVVVAAGVAYTVHVDPAWTATLPTLAGDNPFLGNNTFLGNSIFNVAPSAPGLTLTNSHVATNYTYIITNGATNTVDSGTTNYVALTGGVSVFNGNTSASGSNTLFLSELAAGYKIYTNNTGADYVGTVDAINTDTQLYFAGACPAESTPTSEYSAFWWGQTILTTNVFDLTNTVSGLQTNSPPVTFPTGLQYVAFSNTPVQINGLFGADMASSNGVAATVNAATNAAIVEVKSYSDANKATSWTLLAVQSAASAASFNYAPPQTGYADLVAVFDWKTTTNNWLDYPVGIINADTGTNYFLAELIGGTPSFYPNLANAQLCSCFGDNAPVGIRTHGTMQFFSYTNTGFKVVTIKATSPLSATTFGHRTDTVEWRSTAAITNIFIFPYGGPVFTNTTIRWYGRP